MSSVEGVVLRKSILKSQEAVKGAKKSVRFDEAVALKEDRKPLQVLNFSKSHLFTESLPRHFFEADIGNSSTLKEEVSDNIHPSQKFSHSADVCIVFSREDIPLSYMPEIDANLKKIRSKSNLKVIPIEVKRNTTFEDYARQVIEAIQTVYAQKDEDPKVTNLKNEFADNAKQILSAPRVSEFRKKMVFKDLIKIYAAIDARPDAILNYYEEYQNKLKMIDQDFTSKKKTLFKKSFRDFEQCAQEEIILNNTMQAFKEKALQDLIEDVKEYYPRHSDQAPEASSSSPNHGTKEQAVEEKIETTGAMRSASQLADMSDEAVEKQSSGSVADADIERRLQVEKHTFFYCAPMAAEKVKKDVKKMREKTDSISSALFQSAPGESENVKKEVEQMMKKVEPIYSSP